MNAELADIKTIRAKAFAAMRPPPALTLSEWADAHFYLSPESAAEPGRWKTIPYQRGMMDAVTDPTVEKVSVMKSARVGYTKMMDATIGYYIDQDPCSILVVQPTVEDAKGYSKEEVSPMLRDCPRLTAIVHDDPDVDDGPKSSSNTILHKRYRGGVLSMIGATSGAGFRRVTRRVVIFDEVDGYPPSAGSEGDQIKLGSKRAETFWNRKILAGSTPIIAGSSRIEDLFQAGDQRRYHVPCPQCGHMDFLVFSEDRAGGKGHWMCWPEGKPKEAFFVCRANGCTIEHKDKRTMVERGEWRAEKPFDGHASFHIWTAYSYSPGATWGHIAEEWMAAQGDPKKLKTFINTTLGETWAERGDTPDWQQLYNRREHFKIGEVPSDKSLFLTAGVDVQIDRFVYEVVAWGADKQSWSVDAGVLMAETRELAESDFSKLDDLLSRSFPAPSGLLFRIQLLCIDSGYKTQEVYSWARRHPYSQVRATKGRADLRSIVGTASAVDVRFNGKRPPRGYKMWPVGVDLIKSELYGWLQLPQPSLENKEPYPTGYCHFPEHGEEFFRQITAEQLIATPHKRTGFLEYEWQMVPGRQNHWLDARVYARAGAEMLGLGQIAAQASTTATPTAESAPAPVEVQEAPEPRPEPPRSPPDEQGRFLGGRIGIGSRDKDWLKPKR